MTEKRFTTRGIIISHYGVWDTDDKPYANDEVVDLLNKQDEEIQRWKTLYEIKDAEVTARVDALNEVCEYYTSEVLFKSDVDPNKAVKEVINEILNTPIYEE